MSKYKLQAARDLRMTAQTAKQNEQLAEKVVQANAQINGLIKELDWDALDKINLPVELQLELEKLAETTPEIPTPKKRRAMARI